MQDQVDATVTRERLAAFERNVDGASFGSGDGFIAVHLVANLKDADRTVRRRGLGFPNHCRHRPDHFACRSHFRFLPLLGSSIRGAYSPLLMSPFWRRKRQCVSALGTGTLVMFAGYLTAAGRRKSRNRRPGAFSGEGGPTGALGRREGGVTKVSPGASAGFSRRL